MPNIQGELMRGMSKKKPAVTVMSGEATTEKNGELVKIEFSRHYKVHRSLVNRLHSKTISFLKFLLRDTGKNAMQLSPLTVISPAVLVGILPSMATGQMRVELKIPLSSKLPVPEQEHLEKVAIMAGVTRNLIREEYFNYLKTYMR